MESLVFAAFDLATSLCLLLLMQVSVPGNVFNIVTVRCGHCSNLLSVNLGASPQAFSFQVNYIGSLVLGK